MKPVLRLIRGGSVRGLAAGTLLLGWLTGASPTAAAPSGPIPLDHQMSEHLAPGQGATFQFWYGGGGEVAQIAVMPVGPTLPNLTLKIIGPDNQPISVADQAGGPGIKDDLVTGPVGSYTVEVTNDDPAAVDFLIGEQETELAPPTTDSGSSEAPAGAAEGDAVS